MSAYVVDREHVVYLVEAAMRLEGYGGGLHWGWGRETVGTYIPAELRPGDYDEAVRVGQMLWNECIRSVSARYPDEPVTDLPGVEGEDYTFTRRDLDPFLRIDPVQVLKSCSCYAYQSCEHDGWETSEAYAFIDALRHRAIASLPGYEEAAWGAPEPQTAKA